MGGTNGVVEGSNDGMVGGRMKRDLDRVFR